jgi:hypothetical protein
MSMPRIAAAAVSALALTACAGFLGDQDTASQTPDSMAGRWILAAPNAPACGMNFSGAAGAHEGSVVPEGGCPDKFYTSRRWTLDQNALVIKDDNDEPLAQLKFSGGHFDGQSTAGTPVTLTR